MQHIHKIGSLGEKLNEGDPKVQAAISSVKSRLNGLPSFDAALADANEMQQAWLEDGVAFVDRYVDDVDTAFDS